MSKSPSPALALLALLALVACQGPDGRVVATLSDAEYAEACRDYAAGVGEGASYAQALVLCTRLKQLEGECTPESVDGCVAALEPAPTVCPTNEAFDRSGCEVTVARLEACFDAIYRQQIDAAEALSCDAPVPTSDAALPPACDAVAARCEAALRALNGLFQS